MSVRARLVFAVALAACKQSTPPPSPGAPADCAKVAEIVATYEVGSTAAAEARSAAVTRHRDACKAANVTVTEANCIAKATGTWDLMACAPKMFPQRATSDDCKTVATKMRASIIADMPKEVGSAGVAMVDKMMAVIEASCAEDNWPTAFRTCILDAKPEELVGSKKCEGLLPQELQFKMGERLKPIVKPDAPPPP